MSILTQQERESLLNTLESLQGKRLSEEKQRIASLGNASLVQEITRKFDDPLITEVIHRFQTLLKDKTET